MTPIDQLRMAGIDDPAREWRILQGHFEGEALDDALKRRLARVPMAQILGFRDFWKSRFIVSEDVLDPRPDSELFLEIARAREGHGRNILDLGAGTGALGLSALLEFDDAYAVLADISSKALDICAKNARVLGVDERVDCVQSDWFDGIEGAFDLIFCNPPYLTRHELENAQSELAFEPAIALSDFGDGLKHYRTLAKSLHSHLKKGGIALFEHGVEQQEAVARIFEDEGFETEKYLDLSQNPRIVAVFLPNSEKNT